MKVAVLVTAILLATLGSVVVWVAASSPSKDPWNESQWYKDEHGVLHYLPYGHE